MSSAKRGTVAPGRSPPARSVDRRTSMPSSPAHPSRIGLSGAPTAGVPGQARRHQPRRRRCGTAEPAGQTRCYTPAWAEPASLDPCRFAVVRQSIYRLFWPSALHNAQHSSLHYAQPPSGAETPVLRPAQGCGCFAIVLRGRTSWPRKRHRPTRPLTARRPAKPLSENKARANRDLDTKQNAQPSRGRACAFCPVRPRFAITSGAFDGRRPWQASTILTD